MNQPIALDIDGSLQELEGMQTIELSEWQEAIRFGCSWYLEALPEFPQ